MKNWWEYLICSIAMVFMLVCTFLIIREWDSEYPCTGIVTSISPNNDTVIVEDYNGNLWAFRGCEDWRVGDIAAMTMKDKHTDTIYDDEIVMVRYSGHTK